MQTPFADDNDSSSSPNSLDPLVATFNAQVAAYTPQPKEPTRLFYLRMLDPESTNKTNEELEEQYWEQQHGNFKSRAEFNAFMQEPISQITQSNIDYARENPNQFLQQSSIHAITKQQYGDSLITGKGEI